jgi:hypothetical protein
MKLSSTILDTSQIEDMVNSNGVKLTPEEIALIKQRNQMKIVTSIVRHLEEEIEEGTLSVSSLAHHMDNISINMIEITMNFNELQKRINDMNNPDFWLQKAIQK